MASQQRHQRTREKQIGHHTAEGGPRVIWTSAGAHHGHYAERPEPDSRPFAVEAVGTRNPHPALTGGDLPNEPMRRGKDLTAVHRRVIRRFLSAKADFSAKPRSGTPGLIVNKKKRRAGSGRPSTIDGSKIDSEPCALRAISRQTWMAYLLSNQRQAARPAMATVRHTAVNARIFISIGVGNPSHVDHDTSSVTASEHITMLRQFTLNRGLIVFDLLFLNAIASAKLRSCPKALCADWRPSYPPMWLGIHA